MNEKEIWLAYDSENSAKATGVFTRKKYALRDDFYNVAIPYIRRDVHDIAVKALEKQINVLEHLIECQKVPSPYMIEEAREALERVKK